MKDPRLIALWLENKTKSGHTGVLTETLYGHRVNPGESKMDLFIAAIDRNYLDFDPNNEKFQKLAEKVFGKIPSEQEWGELLQSSSQSDELKQELMSKIGSTSDVPEEGFGLSDKQAWIKSLPQKLGNRFVDDQEIIDLWTSETGTDLSVLTGDPKHNDFDNYESPEVAYAINDAAEELGLPWRIESHGYDGLTVGPA